MEKINDVLMKKAATAVLLVLVSTAGWADDVGERRFQGTLQATTKVEVLPQGRCKGTHLDGSRCRRHKPLWFGVYRAVSLSESKMERSSMVSSS